MAHLRNKELNPAALGIRRERDKDDSTKEYQNQRLGSSIGTTDDDQTETANNENPPATPANQHSPVAVSIFIGTYFSGKTQLEVRGAITKKQSCFKPCNNSAAQCQF